MNTKLKSIYQQIIYCSLNSSFHPIVEAGGMRLFIFILTLFFSLQSCEEKDELEEIKSETPIIENPQDSSIMMEGLPDRRGIIKKGQLLGIPVTYEEIDGMAIFEGDILLAPDDLNPQEEIENGRTSAAGNAAVDRRWPNNIVYYSIDLNLPDKDRVRNAIAIWDVFTNLIFLESTTQPNRIKFVPADGCFSHIGMIGGIQELKVGPQCTTGNVMHEIGHAIGLFHEHSRSDRDKVININWSNIPDTLWYAFEKYAERKTTDGMYAFLMGFDHGKFDFGSIMMYNRYAYAINKSIPTITKKNGTTYTAQRDFPSPGDLACVNDLYPPIFTRVPAPLAKDISVGASGTVYMISRTFHDIWGYSIYRWLGDGLGWTKEQNMSGFAMDVAPDGTPWVISKFNRIYRKVGNTWEQVPGSAQDIAIGADGSIYILGTTPVKGGYRVYKRVNNDWVRVLGTGGVTIDVTPQGNPWVVTSDKQIYYRTNTSRSWIKASGQGYEVTIDSENNIYKLVNSISTDHSLYKWTGSSWLKQPGKGVKIAAWQDNKLWLVKADGTVYRR